ncbi:MAG TPA: hypothetical protein VHE57_00210 [Mycobacteriales bacterium]|nr:hypothetical protein [Mycobacteriales bacterium]
MAAGIVFVALFVVGTFMSIDGPSTDSSDSANVLDQKWVSWLASSSNRVEHVIGAYLLILGGIAFVWFCVGLRDRLERSGAAEDGAGRLVSALSAYAAAAMAAAGMCGAVVAGAVNFGGENAPTSGDAAHWFADLTFPFLMVVFALVSAAIITTCAVAGLRSGALPRWAAYGGLLAALASIFGVLFIPMVLPMLWYLVVAVTGLGGPGPAKATPAEAPAAA